MSDILANKAAAASALLLLKIAAGKELKQQMFERASSMSAYKNVINAIEREAERVEESPIFIMRGLAFHGESECPAVSWPYVWMLHHEWECDYNYSNEDEESQEDDAVWERIKSRVEHNVWLRSTRDRN